MKKNNYLASTLIAFCIFFACIKSNAQTLWGMTTNGGAYSFGEIFSMPTGSTSLTVQHSFVGYGGANPFYTGMVKAANGKYYGMTGQGGVYSGQGTIFSYNPSNGAYAPVYSFATATGSQPRGSLTIGPDGKLYGMTNAGGVNNYGVIFRIDTLGNKYKVLYQFNSTYGINPSGNLLLASNGLFYGLTPQGGTYNDGVLFSVDTAGTYTVLVNFNSATTGWLPHGSLIQATNGLLYGMTSQGGASSYGNIFSYDPVSTTFTSLYTMNGTTTGGYPYGALLQASNGKLSGMTFQGGTNNDGIIFSYDIGLSSFTALSSFTSANVHSPYGSLIQGVNGKLYGVCTAGGTSAWGGVFSYNISTNKIGTLHSNSINDGESPYGAMVQEANGKLLGMAYGGGVAGYGTFFECDTLGVFVKKWDFDYAPKGGIPGKALFQAADGKLYGMTTTGGINNDGVIFTFDPYLLTYKVIYNFSFSSGSGPYGSLIQGSNGLLYGMTFGGGAHSGGVIFSCDTSGSPYTDLYDFSYTSGGVTPHGVLLTAANNKLYGMTESGGSGSYGELFSFKISSKTYTPLYGFSSDRAPYGSLIQANNGKLYGMTLNGGSGDGAIFNYDTIKGYTHMYSFGFSDGELPNDNLYQASNNLLYGMAQGGGTNSGGVLFTIDTAKAFTFTQLYNFNSPTGAGPEGTVMEASDGKLYGVTTGGGSGGAGVVFQYDISSNTYAVMYNFSGPDGNVPNASLIEVKPIITGAKQLQTDATTITLYPNPNKGVFKLSIKHPELVPGSHLIIAIYNMLGEEIYTAYSLANTQIPIDLSNQAAGIYLYRVTTEKGELVGSGKLVIN